MQSILWTLFVVASLTMNCAHAVPTTTVDDDGFIVGVADINVDGTLYDVTFTDGSCESLFADCNQSTDFAFQSSNAALVAAKALVEQVFVNANSDSTYRVLGCVAGTFGGCAILIPFAPPQFPTFSIQDAYVQILTDAGDKALLNLSMQPEADSALFPGLTYARFTPSSVPAPGTLPSLLLTFGTIVLTGRLRNMQ